MHILRGDLFLVDFNPSKASIETAGAEIRKTRPALVISSNGVNRVRLTVVVVPLSTAPTPADVFAVSVPSAGPLSVAVCDQVTTINKATRLVKHVGKASLEDLRAVEQGVREALDL